MKMDREERRGLTARLEVFGMSERLGAQMAIIAHSHGSHVLALFVGSIVPALVFAGIVVFEESGA